MTIGEAARRAGLSAKMARHYETLGLVSPMRRDNGYREFGEREVAVLRFIRHARDLGFPLDDVKQLVELWQDRTRPSSEVKRIALDHVGALEKKARELQAMASSLHHLAAHCHGDERPDCPILEGLERSH